MHIVTYAANTNLSRPESAFRALCLSVTSRRGNPPLRRPARRGVTAAALTGSMLTVLLLAGGTAPPRPCS